MAKVAIKRADYSNIEEKIRDAIDLIGGIKKFINKNDKVLLKPNLLRASKPDEGIITSLEVIKAVIRIVKKTKAEIYLGDSPPFWDVHKIAEESGVKKICDELNVKIIGFEGRDFKVDGEIVKNLKVFKDFQKYKIINLPKLKTHGLTVYTGAMKNLFGLMPGLNKAKMHLRFQNPEIFSRMIRDINKLVKPTLNIMDGIVGMEGDGPNNGNVRKFNFIGVSEDAIALDVVCSRLMGFDIKEIPMLEQMKVEVVGDRIERVKNLKKPGKQWNLIRALNFLRNYIIALPYVNKNKCNSCRSCYKVCPARAIKMEKYPVFDYNKCIKCYSCNEVCPEKAIYLKRNWITRILGI